MRTKREVAAQDYGLILDRVNKNALRAIPGVVQEDILSAYFEAKLMLQYLIAIHAKHIKLINALLEFEDTVVISDAVLDGVASDPEENLQAFIEAIQQRFAGSELTVAFNQLTNGYKHNLRIGKFTLGMIFLAVVLVLSLNPVLFPALTVGGMLYLAFSAILFTATVTMYINNKMKKIAEKILLMDDAYTESMKNIPLKDLYKDVCQVEVFVDESKDQPDSPKQMAYTPKQLENLIPQLRHRFFGAGEIDTLDVKGKIQQELTKLIAEELSAAPTLAG